MIVSPARRNRLGGAASAILSLLVLASPLAAQTNVSGNITVDTTWDLPGSPYILTGDVTVRQTTSGPVPTLIIDPGVEVQLNDRVLRFGDGSYAGLLDAEGVTFTGAGSIARVRFSRGAGQRLSACELLGAYVQAEAGSGTISNIHVDGFNSSYGISASGSWTITGGLVENALSTGITASGTLTISGTTIRNCGGTGLQVSYGSAGSTISASNLTIIDNGMYGVSLSNCSGIVAGCVISGHTYPYLLAGGNPEIGGNDISGNTNHAIATAGLVGLDTTWRESWGMPVVLVGDVTVRGIIGAISTLTIEPGVEVQLNDRILSLGDLNYGGVLDAEGVTFTGTGSNARVRFRRGAGQRLAACEILGACIGADTLSSGTISNIHVDGFNSSYGISASGSWTITGGLVENAHSTGITASGTLTISGTTIRNCGGMGLHCWSIGATIQASNLAITDNGTYGVSLSNCSGAVSGCVISGHTYPFELVGGNPQIGGNDIAGNTNQAIATHGYIYIDTTWRSSWGMPVVLEYNLTVLECCNAPAPTLTIEPGVEVQLNDGVLKLGDYISGYRSGVLDAEGVTFTGTGPNASVNAYYNSGGPQDRLDGCSFVGAALRFNGGVSASVTGCSLGSITIPSSAAMSLRHNNLSESSVELTGTAFAPVDIQHNYWGTTTSALIEARITDCVDSSTRPCAVWYPPLQYSPVEYGSQPEIGEDIPTIQVEMDHLWIWNAALGRFVSPGGPITIATDRPTYLLAHGWDGDMTDEQAMSSIACSIYEANPNVNLLAWEWSAAANPDGIPNSIELITPAAVALLVDPSWSAILAAAVWLDAYQSGANAKSQGNILGKALADLIRENGSLGTELHLIGHSHGGGLLGQAAQKMNSLGYPASSLITLDTPKVACVGSACLINSLRYVDPSSVEHAAVFYYTLLSYALPCGGVGAPLVAGATNVRLNCSHVPLLNIAHSWINGPDDGVCPTSDGWCPSAIWDAGSGQARSVHFDGQGHSLLDPVSFPVGTFEEGQLFQFQSIPPCCDGPRNDGDETEAMTVRLNETFESASSWTGTRAVLVTGADPDNPENRAVLLQEVGEASFFRDIDWPANAIVLKFDYMFVEPRGEESLTVYVGDEILYYDTADTALALGHLTSSGSIIVSAVAGRTARLNFVLRTDGEPGGAVVLDNVRVYSLRNGDNDGDGDIDSADFAALASCLAGPGLPAAAGCDDFDIDADADIDLQDFARFQRVFTGEQP